MDHDDDVLDLADQLEAECPWDTVSAVLSHEGWCDLVSTIKAVSPEAFETMKRDLLNRDGKKKAALNSHSGAA